MAKIKINGDSSGYVEIAAPNAANNNTLELGPGTKILTDKNTHISNIGIGTANPRYPLEVNSGNLLVSGSAQGNLILEDRGVGDSSRPFALLASNDGNFTITNANRNASGTTTSSVERLRITSDGKVGLGEPSPDFKFHSKETGGPNIVGLFETNQTDAFISFRASGTTANSTVRIGAEGDDFRAFINGAERLRITSDGKLTITTATNSASAATGGDNLVIKDSDGSGITILSGDGNSQNIYMGSTSDNDGVRLEGFYNSGSPYFNIYTGGTHRLRIDSSGNLLLKTGEIDIQGGNKTVKTSAGFLQVGTSGSHYLSLITAGLQRLNITSAGLVGINHASAAQIGKILTIRPADGDGIRFIRPGETASNPNKHLDLTTTTSGSAYPSGEGYTVKYNTYNNDQIFTTYVGGGTGGHIAFKTAPQGGTPSERVIIDPNGAVLIGAGSIDNTSSHATLIAHAPTSGNTIFKAIEIGSSAGNNTDRGATICGQPKSNSHSPFTLVGSWDSGTTNDVYYGGGWGSAMRPAMKHRFYTAASYPTANSSGSLNMVLDGNGHLTLPNQPVFQATGQPSHRYMNSWQATDLPNWNHVTQNGSHFNNSTGRFTAPVAGKYYFIFTAMFTNPSTNDVATYIIKNGTTEVLSNNHSGGGNSNGHQWNDITVHAIVNMAVNDWVSARMVANSSATCYFYGATGSKYGSFSGFLIG